MGDPAYEAERARVRDRQEKEAAAERGSTVLIEAVTAFFEGKAYFNINKGAAGEMIVTFGRR